MQKKLTLKLLIRLVFLVLLTLALVLAGAVYFLLQSEQAVRQTQNDRFNYFNKADMVRLYSMQKSIALRGYVVTGDVQKLSLYQKK